ncbi:MAG: glycosyltransferase family 2 protein [Pseudomonadota bacterium]
MWRDRILAVVLPAFNEGRLIHRCVDEQPAFVDHVVVVDDASTDDTAQQARASNRPGLHVLRHASNRGVGAATVTGYREALRLGAELIVGSNGDAQMNPDDTEGLLQGLLDGADLVRGNRFARPDTLGAMPVERRMATRALSVFMRLATGIAAVHDSQSGFHALTRDALQRLDLDVLWPGYGFPNDLVARAAEAGLRIAEVPVDARYGTEKSGIRPWHALHPVGTRITAAALRRLFRRRVSLAFAQTEPRDP